MKKVLFYWNGTILSALALNEMLKNQDFKVQALVVFLSEETSTINKNGLPETLIIDQAKLMNLPLVRIFISDTLNELEKTTLIKTKLELFLKIGIDTIVFPDIKNTTEFKFNDIWAKEVGLSSFFPLLEKSEAELVQTFFKNEYRAIVTAVNLDHLESSYLNKEYNQDWIASLPANVSKIGENDEFNTVVIFGPMFKMRLNYSKSMANQYGKILVTLLKGP